MNLPKRTKQSGGLAREKSTENNQNKLWFGSVWVLGSSSITFLPKLTDVVVVANFVKFG